MLKEERGGDWAVTTSGGFDSRALLAGGSKELKLKDTKAKGLVDALFSVLRPALSFGVMVSTRSTSFVGCEKVEEFLLMTQDSVTNVTITSNFQKTYHATETIINYSTHLRLMVARRCCLLASHETACPMLPSPEPVEHPRFQT